MTVYMDTHEGSTELPSELRRIVTERVRSREKDQFGVIDHGIIIDREGNRMHCILEAPDVDAIKRHHEALAVPLRAETIHRAELIMR